MLQQETSKEGGTLYFGDNERGHVLSHTFTLQDSLARGFHRKYSILILMCDKVRQLNTHQTDDDGCVYFPDTSLEFMDIISETH